MKSKRIIALRGLSRGQKHWGVFPQTLNSLDSEIDLELLEIPGNGTRASEDCPLDAAKVVRMIREKSRFVKNQQSFSILGISLGGMIALKWAELYPAEVSKVFTVNSSLSQLSPFYERLQFRQLPEIFKALRQVDFLEREKIILSITANDHQKRNDQLLPMSAFSKQFPVRRSSFLRQLLLAARLKVEVSPKIPIRIIFASKDRLVNPACSVSMAQYFSVDPIIHTTAGHDIPLDDPLWLSNIIIDELSK